MKNLIFASFVMLVFAFCSCSNNKAKDRTEELAEYAKELHLTNERLAYYMSGIEKQDSIISTLKEKILNPKISIDKREKYLKDYSDRMEMKFPSSVRVGELETQKSKLQRGISDINPTHDELRDYGLLNYLK